MQGDLEGVPGYGNRGKESYRRNMVRMNGKQRRGIHDRV
jgi:hypothetical protein